MQFHWGVEIIQTHHYVQLPSPLFPSLFHVSVFVRREDWWIASHLQLEGSMKAVLSALTVTAMAFVLIFGLDKVAEAWP